MVRRRLESNRIFQFFDEFKSQVATMNALVLGASGHIGNAIVRELLRRGYQVTATGRRRQRPLNLADLPVTYLSGDQENPGQLERWVAGHPVVIDAAAPYPVDLHDRAVPYAERRTNELLNALIRHEAILGYVSSFTTLKKTNGDIQEWPARFARDIHPYFAIKESIEAAIMSASREGLRATIVNPTMCFGPWDMHERELCLIPRLLCGEVLGSVNHNLNVVDVREVATGLVSAIESGWFGRPTIFSGHNISAQGLFRWICEIGGVAPPALTAPASVTAFASYAVEALAGIAGGNTPIQSLAPILIYQHEWLPPCAAFRELAVRVRPLYETLLDSVEWYRRIGYC
jgi:dihydroflavonol-4-reductase